jgi:hypothetical protein
MYAVVRENRFDPQRLARGGEAMRAFQVAHAAQPGYCGSLAVDLADGRQISVTLWRSEAEAEAARRALGPVIGSTLAPMMASPSVLVGVGAVAFDDLSGRLEGIP